MITNLDFKDGNRFDATEEYLYCKKIDDLTDMLFVAEIALKYYADISLDPDIAIQAQMKLDEMKSASNTQR
jgi:hypothetical protein